MYCSISGVLMLSSSCVLHKSFMRGSVRATDRRGKGHGQSLQRGSQKYVAFSIMPPGLHLCSQQLLLQGLKNLSLWLVSSSIGAWNVPTAVIIKWKYSKEVACGCVIFTDVKVHWQYHNGQWLAEEISHYWDECTTKDFEACKEKDCKRKIGGKTLVWECLQLEIRSTRLWKFWSRSFL